MSETLKRLRARHAKEERELVRRHLVEADGMIGKARRSLGVAKSTLQALIRRHGLAEWYARRSPGSGRPKATA